MIAIFAIGTIGLGLLLTGLSFLLRKPIGSTIPPRGPALGVMAAGTVLIAVALWGNKNPRELDRFLRRTETACPALLTGPELFQLTQDRATQFSGRKVEGGWCEYDFEFRSGRKIKGKVELDLSAREEEWLATCGNHPLTQGEAEVWMKRLEDEAQLLCFLTKHFQGAIWLAKEDDGLRWQRMMQSRLPMIAF